jgi:hypothetical protein
MNVADGLEVMFLGRLGAQLDTWMVKALPSSRRSARVAAAAMVGPRRFQPKGVSDEVRL